MLAFPTVSRRTDKHAFRELTFAAMSGQTLEPWQQLCELAAREQDPDHLMELIHTINRLLDEKEQQLKRHERTSDDRAQ